MPSSCQAGRYLSCALPVYFVYQTPHRLSLFLERFANLRSLSQGTRPFDQAQHPKHILPNSETSWRRYFD